MITVSKEIISRSVQPNSKAIDLRRDSDAELDFVPQRSHGKKRKNRGSKRNGVRDPFPQISIDDLNYDSDEELKKEQESAKNQNTQNYSINSISNGKNNNKKNNLNHNLKSNLRVETSTGNIANFQKQTVTPSMQAPKSALSAMILVAEAQPDFGRMQSKQQTIQGYKGPRIDQNQTRAHANTRQKRVSVRRPNLNHQSTNDDFDSSDSDIAEQRRANNPLDARYSRYQQNDKNNLNTIQCYFEEFKNEDPITLNLYHLKNGKINTNHPKLVNELITEAFAKCKSMNRNLRTTNSDDYVLKDWDDDEIGDIPLDNFSALKDLGVDAIVMCYSASKNKNNNSNDSLNPNDLTTLGDKGRESRAVTLDRLQTDHGKQGDNTITFIRIQVPGPNVEAYVFPIDKYSKSLLVRDLCGLLNKKKNYIAFNPQYFDFYYQGLTSKGLEGPLDKKIRVLELKKKELVVLPRKISNDDEKQRAFNFDLVKLANEVATYKAFKIKNAQQKKSRILMIDRYRIVKQSPNDGNRFNLLRQQDRVPIGITTITSVKINVDNSTQFILEYNHPSGGKRKHTYELSSKQECAQCVSKIKYLTTLRKLQG